MTFKTEPYEHQLTDYERFKDADFFALLWDMGTGKSKLAIDICAYKAEVRQDVNACLVIAPNNVHAQWTEEQFPVHCSIPYVAHTWRASNRTSRREEQQLTKFLDLTTPKLKVLAVNVEAFQSKGVIPYIARFVKEHECFIIVDEATRIKTPTARRSRMVHRLNKYGYRCLLTGTPTAKSPFDLWSMFEFLKGNYFGCNYFVFQHRYGVMMRAANQATGRRFQTVIDEKTWNIVQHKLKTHRKQRGGELMDADIEAVSVMTGVSEKNVRFMANHSKYTRYKNLDDLRKIIAPVSSAVRKEDCLDLPPKVYEQLIVDPSPELMRIYKELKTELLVEYEGQELSVLNKIALTTRLLQICGGFFPYRDDEANSHARPIGKRNAKIDALVSDLDEIGDRPLIVWAQFTREIDLIHQALMTKGYEARKFYGKTGSLTRERLIREFRDSDFQVLVANPAVAGFGLNLQHATLQYYFSNSFRVEDRLQAEDRSHRLGAENTCVYKDIVLKGTIDERVYAAIRDGRNMNDYFKSRELREIFDEQREIA